MKIRNLGILTAAAAAAAFAGGASAANLVNYWSFEGGFGDSVGSGGGTAGVDVGTTAGHDGNTAATFPSAITAGGAFNSDGYIDTTASAIAGDYSFSYWFNIGTNAGNPRGIFDFSGDGGDGPQSLFTAAGDLVFRIDGGTGNVVANAGGGWDDGNWHFVVANFDTANNQLDIHIDGAGVDATNSVGTIGTLTWDVDQYLGAFNVNTLTNRGLDGSLDDFAIYTGNLTASEIDALFAGTIQPTDVVPEPGSLALLGLGGLALIRRRRA